MVKLQRINENEAYLFTSYVKYIDRYNMEGKMQTYKLKNNGGSIEVTKEVEFLPFYADWYDMKNLENLMHYDREVVDTEESGFKYRDVYIKYEHPMWRSGTLRMKRLRHVLSKDNKYELRYERMLHQDAFYTSCFMGDKFYTVSNTRQEIVFNWMTNGRKVLNKFKFSDLGIELVTRSNCVNSKVFQLLAVNGIDRVILTFTAD
jgi:hypothetical protein